MAERRISKDGQWILERQDDGTITRIPVQGAQQMPADPTFQYQEPKARLDNQLTEAQIRKAALDASQASATQPYDVRKAAADAAKAEAEAAALLARQAKRGDNNPAGKLAGILKSIDDIAVDAKDNGGFGETGYWGSWLRDRPGTAAYDLQRKIDKIDANNAFSELQQMRENSPTGGALGGIAVEELKMLKSTVASLDPNMSQEEFLAQLQTARDHYADLIGRIDPTNKYAAPVDYRDDEQVAALAAGKMPPAAGSQGSDRSAPLPTGPSFGGPQGDPSGFVPYGSTTRRMDNPQWAGVNEAVKGMIIAGRSPDAIRAYLGERGINTNVEGLNQAADYFRKTGKRDFRVNVDDIEVPMSGFEQFRNNAPQTALGAGVASAANAVALGVPQALAPEQMQYIRDQNPFPAFVGDVAGIVGATSGIGAVGNSLARSLAPRALTGGGRLGNAARAVAPDAAYGAAYGGITEGDPLTGAATAAAGSGAGQLIGAPVGKALANIVQPSPTAMRAVNTLGGMFGSRPKPTLPEMSTAQRMMVDAVGDRGPQVLNNLQQAAQMGVPMSLADADTGLTALGGAAVRRSPDARNVAINAFEPRAQGQYDRLVGAVERDFGPVANIPQRSEDLIQQARTAARPLYEPLESMPPRTSPALDEMLNTNTGINAMRNATQIADADQVPAGIMNIGTDAAGNPTFTATPNFQTLNYVKQGFDRSLEAYRNPVTGKLDLSGDPLARATEGLRSRFVSEMDNLYPGYADARAAYAGPAGERQAFQQGVGARNMTPDSMAYAIKDMPDPRLEQFRLGRISDIVDQAGKVKYASNPWNSVVGSPAEQQRLALLYPENAPSFIRQYQLERDLARSQNAILGGSPTAERQLMDQAFQGNLAGDMALDAMTTGAPIKSGINILGRLSKDELGRLGAEKKAKELAPILFDTDAARAAAAFRKSKKAKKARGMFGRRGARAGASVVSAPVMASGNE